MRYEVREQNAELFGVHAEADFSIAASGKAFQVLISGLYSDKPQSIVRETLANADDGNTAFRLRCIENDIEPPELSIDVHAPTVWEPWYSVRDHGIGMSHRFIMTLYSRLFHSEKDQSDDLVGSFGLGSKSPFAYTNEFTVAVVLHGIKRIYTAFLTSTGAPKIVLNDAVWTEEPRGVTVTIPVREKDHKAFNEAISWASLGHSSEITCNKPALVQRATFTHSYGAVHFFDTSKVRLPVNGPFVAVGPVWYPINWATVTASGGSLSCSDFWTSMENAVLRLPIGAVEVVPSREAISYSEATIEAILGAYNTVTDKRLAELQAEFETPESIWDKAAAVERMLAELPYSDSVLLRTFDKLTKPYTKMNGAKVDADARELRTFTIGQIASNVPGAPTHRLSLASEPPSQFYRGSSTTAVLVVDEAVEPLPKNYRQRLRHTMTKLGLKTVYVAVMPDPLAVRSAAASLRKELNKHVLFKSDEGAKRSIRVERLSNMFKSAHRTRTALKAFVDEFQCPNVLLLSDLVMPPKDIVERAKALTLLRTMGNGSMEDTTIRETDDAGRLFYVVTANRRASSAERWGRVSENDLNKVLEELGQPKVRLLGFGVSQKKQVAAEPMFQHSDALDALFTPEMRAVMVDTIKTHDRKEIIWNKRKQRQSHVPERLRQLQEVMGDQFPEALAAMLRAEKKPVKAYPNDVEFYAGQTVAGRMKQIARILKLDFNVMEGELGAEHSEAKRYLRAMPQLHHHSFEGPEMCLCMALILGLDAAETILCRSYGPPEAPSLVPMCQAA